MGMHPREGWIEPGVRRPVSRRQFLAGAGGVAGFAAVVVAGAVAGFAAVVEALGAAAAYHVFTPLCPPQAPLLLAAKL